MSEVSVEEGGPGGGGGHAEVAEVWYGCGRDCDCDCDYVVCVVGLLDVGCWFSTVDCWLLGLEVFILGISGLGLDWDWVGQLTSWIHGAEGVDKYVLKRFDARNWYISFCWM
jgi:hypothetical protein